PRRYAMLGFGGAGPAHAARVARILGVREVLIPPASGAASALGFLVAPISFEFVTSLPGVLDQLDLDAVNTLLGDLEAKGRAPQTSESTVPAGVARCDVIRPRAALPRPLAAPGSASPEGGWRRRSTSATRCGRGTPSRGR